MKSYRDFKYLAYAQSGCDETILHLAFLYETESLKEKDSYQKFHTDYDRLSKKINKFIQWVENNWNEFPHNETGNLPTGQAGQ